MTPALPSRGPRTAATLEQVAARAGVSRATASRVLRGASNVSEHAREAVQRAAAESGYTPNFAARSLVTGRSDSVAFLVEETEERMFADPFFLGMLRSAHEVLTGAGMQLVFTVVSRPEDMAGFVSYAASGHVDGVLLLSLHGRDELPVRLEEAGVPAVLSGRPLGVSDGLFYVDADNVEGGRLATDYLLGQGRRSVGTVTGPLDMCAGQDRLAGYRRGVEGHGAHYDPSLVSVGDFTIAGGQAAMARLLGERPDVDAVFAASDLAAVGAIRAVQAVGRRVPEDVAVVGFDDVPAAAEHIPPLTTVRQPIADMGTAMTRVLLARMAGDQASPATLLPVELVLRETA